MILRGEPDASLDAIDLLDVPDWLQPPARRELWGEVGRVLRPGGRCLTRSISRRPDLPGPGRGLVLDGPLSRQLTAMERTAVYGSVTVLRRAAVESGPAGRPVADAPVSVGPISAGPVATAR